jgi:hypothetical protein
MLQVILKFLESRIWCWDQVAYRNTISVGKKRKQTVAPVPRVALGATRAESAAAGLCAAAAAVHLWPPFSLIPGLLAGGKGSGVHPFSRSGHNRVCRCSAVEFGFAGGVWLLCGLVFLAAPAMQKQRCCRGIISSSFFRSPMAIYSDVNGEPGETCPGVEGRRVVVFFRWWCCWSC